MTEQIVSTTKPQNPLQPWIVCLTAALFFFYEFMQMHLFSGMSAELMRDLGIDAIRLSYLSSSFLFANTCFLLPAGLILDRISVKHCMIAGMILCIFGTLLLSIAEQMWLAAVGRFAAGIANAFCFLSCILLIARWFPSHQRAFVSAVVVTVAMFGGVIAQTPLRLMTDWIGWRQTLWFVAAEGICFLILIARFVADRPDQSTHSDPNPHPDPLSFFEGLRLSVRNLNNTLCGLYTGLMNLPIILLGAVWGNLYLHQVHALSTTQATSVTSLLFWGTIIGAPLFGAYSDYRRSRIFPMSVGALASLLVIGYCMLTPQLSIGIASGCFLLLGFFTSAQVLAYPKITESNPPHLQGTALGYASTFIMGLAACSQPLFGHLMQLGWDHRYVDQIPVYSTQNYLHAMLLFPIGFAIALAAASFLFVKTTHNKRIRDAHA